MHLRIDRKRIGGLRGIEIFEEELGQKMRLMHLIDARAETKKLARQIAEATLAARFPMTRELHAVVDRIGRGGDQIFAAPFGRRGPRVGRQSPGKEHAAP